MRIHKNRTLVVALAVTMLLSACQGAETPAPQAEQPTQAPTAAPTAAQAEPTATAAPEPTAAPAAEPTKAAEPATGALGLPVVDPSTVTGDIIAAGSSTVYPLTEWVAEQFKDQGYAGNITIDSIGSGAGLERFCKAGETDIANASRAIKSSEVEDCKAIGRTPIEFRVGTDALAVVVNPENTWADNLTTADLAAIFSGEAKTWQDVNPNWPAEPIKLFSPGTDSGTFDYFVEHVFADIKETADREAKILNAPGIQLSEDDNILVQGVAGDKGAIGYFGYAYYVENKDKLRVMNIDGVEPNDETVNANTYPLSRPLFIYSDAKIMKDKPQVAAFINFYLQNQDEGNKAVGYFPAPESAKNAAAAAWLEAVGK